MILIDADVCETVSAKFGSDEHDADGVKEIIGNYAYVGKYIGSDNAVFWKKTPTDNYVPEKEQLFIYHNGNDLIFQVRYSSRVHCNG